VTQATTMAGSEMHDTCGHDEIGENIWGRERPCSKNGASSECPFDPLVTSAPSNKQSSADLAPGSS